MTNQIHWRIPIIVLVGATLLLISCGDDEASNSDQAPEIPPPSTLIIDFSDFVGGNQAPPIRPPYREAPAATKLNWGQAALAVSFWNIVLTVQLVIPVAAFVGAQNHFPRRDGDSWVWSYEVSPAGVQHRVRLTAIRMEDEIHWKMFLSKAGLNPYTDFRWYTGVSNLTNTQGSWMLNLNPQDPVPFLDIEWNRNPQAGTADITYTYAVPGADENGAFISYGINNESPYNAFYNIFSQKFDQLNNIEWNRTTKNGRIKTRGDWRYWNETLDDIPPPAE